MPRKLKFLGNKKSTEKTPSTLPKNKWKEKYYQLEKELNRKNRYIEVLEARKTMLLEMKDNLQTEVKRQNMTIKELLTIKK